MSQTQPVHPDTEPIQRDVVEAFYRAYAARDIALIAPFLDDDIKFTISGPVDVLPFCGVRHGKVAVLDLIERQMPAVFRVFSFVTENMLVDGDRASTLNRLSAWRNSDGRVISYRLAHFMRFRNGQVAEILSLIDSFDAVEQVIGHPLDVHDTRDAALDCDLVAV